jgi:hypothetical protein
MKTKLFLFGAIVAAGLGFTACEADDPQDDVITKTASMTGDQEVPAVTTSGTGTVSYSYNKSNKTLTYTATWQSLNDSASAMHIHGLAVRGQSAIVFQSFTLNTVQRRKEGTYTGNLFIDGTSIKEADLLAGKYYLNLHSKANPGGELRAQLEF